jgi:aspartyl-tRNA(Asn)/glutamyl-tRNA(Gln) amidotransferase subunit B
VLNRPTIDRRQRAGEPEADLRTAEQARRYAEELQLLLRSIGASDADMEKGQLRVEANVSLRHTSTDPFGTRVEVKNMNSFRAVERAIDYEIERQAAALDAGETLGQETRGWDEGRGATYHMRSKEYSEDYRYFPEPDLPPLHVDATWLADIRAQLPELPAARRDRYQRELGLSAYDASVLVSDPASGALFEATLAVSPTLDSKLVANWVTGPYLAVIRAGARPHEVQPAELADLVRRVAAAELSGTNAKEVLAALAETGGSVAAIVEARGFRQISDAGALGPIVEQAIAANPGPVADYRAGKVQAIGFLVGQVMKATRGQANAGLAAAEIRERLGEPDEAAARESEQAT